MKTKKAAAIRALIRSEIEVTRNADGIHTLSIQFDNRAVDIPYEPWRPRTSVKLPGRWVQDGDDA